MQLEGKTALITGGAHRVGKAITMMLANSGANVIVNYHSSSAAAEQTILEAKELGVDSYVVKPMRDETIESVLKTTLMAASH